MKKDYTISINSNVGAEMHIEYCTYLNTYYTYYNGRVTQHKYLTLSGASRYLDRVAEMWSKQSQHPVTINKGTASNIKAW